MSITPVLTVNDLIRLYPAALPILAAAGIDSCCGGDLPLAAAAHGAGLTFDQLAARLRGGASAADDRQAAPPSCGCERKAG